MSKRTSKAASTKSKPAKKAVPQSILAAIKNDRKAREEYLKNRDFVVAQALEVFKARARARKAWARTDAGKQIRKPTDFSLAAIDKAVWSYVKKGVDKNTIVLRPMGEPAKPPPPPPVGLAPPEGNQYQHSFNEAHGRLNLRDWLLIGFLSPILAGKVIALLAADWYEDDSDDTVLKFSFANQTAPGDGYYMVRAFVVALGKTGLYADTAAPTTGNTANTKHFAEARIRAAVVDAGEDMDDVPFGAATDVLVRTGIAVNLISDFVEMGVVSRLVPLRGGKPLGFTVQVKARVSARGEHSTAVINMLPGVGGVACIGATIEHIGPLS